MYKIKKVTYCVLFIFCLTYISFCTKEHVVSKRIFTDPYADFTLQKIWKSEVNSNKYGTLNKKDPLPFVYHDTCIYNTNKGCIIYSFDKKKVIRMYNGFRYIAKDIHSGILYLANNKKIRSIYLAKNEIQWTIKNPLPAFDFATCDKRLLVVTDEQLRLCSIKTNNGTVAWKKNKPDPVLLLKNNYPEELSMDSPGKRMGTHTKLSKPVLSKSSLVIGTKNGYLLSFNAFTGKRNYRIPLQYPGNGPIVCNDNMLFLGVTTGILVINSDNGVVEKKFIIGDIYEETVSESSLISNKTPRITCMLLYKNHIYSYSRTGQGIVTSIDPYDLTIIWSITHGYTGQCGYADLTGMTVALGRIWIAPLGPLHNTHFYGINIINSEAPIVKFSKEKVRNLQDKELMRYGEMHPRWHYYKKLPLLEWNNQLILVDIKDITAYKIIPMYKKVNGEWVENKKQ